MLILQYRSVDGTWIDEPGYGPLDQRLSSQALFESIAASRGAEWRDRHRLVLRTDEVVWPLPIDPASQMGA